MRRFVLVAACAMVLEGRAAIIVGGPKYAAYEIDRGRPITEMQRVDR